MKELETVAFDPSPLIGSFSKLLDSFLKKLDVKFLAKTGTLCRLPIFFKLYSSFVDLLWPFLPEERTFFICFLRRLIGTY